MSFTASELLERRNWMGGSEVAMALGLSPFKTRLQLYREKVGEPEPKKTYSEYANDDEADLPLLVGQYCEPLVLDLLQRRKNISISAQQTRWVSQTLPFLRATIDGIGSDRSLVEAKTAGFMGKSWGEDETDQIPMYYIYQVQANLECTGLEFAWVPAIIGNTKVRIYRIDRDPALFDLMVPGLQYFWNCVKTRTPPPAQTRGDVKLLFPYDLGTSKSTTPEIEQIVGDYVFSKAEEKRTKEDIERLHVAITSYMGPSSELVDQHGNVLCTFNTQNGPSRLDKETVEELYPGLIEEHTKPGDPVRVLRLKKPSTAKKKRK